MGNSVMWRGVEFSRVRLTEWSAGKFHQDGRIMMMTHDGISCLVPPKRIRRQAVIDLTDERLGQSLAEQIKLCSECLEWYPATPNYFHIDKNGRYGLHHICIGCKKQYDQHRYDKRKRRKIATHNISPKT